MPKTPQDHKPKGGGHQFTAKGKTYTLPPIDEKASTSVPGGVTMDLMMDPTDQQAQLVMAFHMLKAVKPSDAAMAALRAMDTKDMLEVIASWMGESSGSSTSSADTEEPSSTTSGTASA